jgi:hypothetical protein
MFRRRSVTVLIVLLLFTLWGTVAAAQGDSAAPSDDSESIDYFARYEGIPASRAEDGAFVLGNPEAPVTVVEFADFLCVHCQTYQSTAHQFIETYVATGQARFEYRLFPVVNPNYSPYTAQLAECVDEQIEGGFWPAHDLLYDLAVERSIGPDTAQVVADTLEVDYDALVECAETATQYQIDATLASSSGITGTPAVMIRLQNGDLGFASIQGRTFDRGGLPLEVLEVVMEAEDASDVVMVPQKLLDERLLVDDSLVTGEPCAAPCWQGITPGETPWDEAVEIVQSNEDYANFDLLEAETGVQKLFSWSQVDGLVCCQLFTQDGETVAAVLLLTTPQVTTGELIEAQGEPVYAFGNSSGQGEVVLNLFYPELGLIVYAYAGDPGDGSFNEDSPVIGAQYIATALMSQIVESTPLFDWQGYDALQGYFPQAQSQ